MSDTKITLVSAFFRLHDRAIDEDEQFRRFEQLASSDVPVILFLDEQLMYRAPSRHNVYVVPTKLGKLNPFQIELKNPRPLPEGRHSAKDTRDFILLQNCKVDFLHMALDLDDATHFAWIDFGIMKVAKEPEKFLQKLTTIAPPARCILMPGCWPASNETVNEDTVNWRFCGGFLLADRESIPGLAKDNFLFFCASKKLTWEVNIWAQLEKTKSMRETDITWYPADHDDSIVNIDVGGGSVFGTSKPRICLVMIVKNESAIIERCLQATLPFIDSWCITDTGSSDNTAELIRYFFEKNSIRGSLLTGEFHDFAQARNLSLDNARLVGWDWDYALLMDADMVLEGSLDFASLVAPAYKLLQRNGHLNYFNVRLVRRDVFAKYFGVTHEYLSVEGVEQIDSLSFDDRNDGGSKSDKGPRDIRLLKKGLEDEPSNGRYMFYLAQASRDMGLYEEAIKYYELRIKTGGWDEEIWASWYGLALTYKAAGSHPQFIAACLDAYNFRPSRGESLHQLAEFYRSIGKNEAACLIAKTLEQIPYPGDQLFVERDTYDFVAKKELAIAGFYSKIPRIREDGYKSCSALTVHPNGSVREEARKNFTYYAKSAKELFGAETRHVDWTPDDGWAPMNPSICIRNNGQILLLIRTVNYKVTDGQYPTIDGSGFIRTKNYILKMNADDWTVNRSHPLLDASGREVSSFPVEGFEDCRLWETRGGMCCSATVRDSVKNTDGRCEMASFALDGAFQAFNIHYIRDYEYDRTQKNWMPISGHPDRFLYLCDPTVVIDADPHFGTKELSRDKPNACLIDFRGGSQLIPHNNGWLCLVHEVAWRPERVYLHRFVKLDSNFHVEGITDPFYFQHVGIEFCAGLARDENGRLIASYGVNDASAHLAFFDPEAVDSAIRYL